MDAIDCLYCGGRYARANSCPNCGAPNRAPRQEQPTTVAFWMPMTAAAFDGTSLKRFAADLPDPLPMAEPDWMVR